MRWMKCVALIGLVLPLSGCFVSVTPSLSKDVPPNNANGVVAGTFNRTERTDLAFIIRNIGSGTEYTMSAGSNADLPKGVTKRVMAIELPPGLYAISYWEAFTPITKDRWGKYPVTNAYMSATFDLRPGEVFFLGDYWLNDAKYNYGNNWRLSWDIHPQKISLAAAHAAFSAAYPAYANNDFACRLCTDTVRRTWPVVGI